MTPRKVPTKRAKAGNAKAGKKSGTKSVSKSAVPMMPARNGGMIRRGSLPGNTPGTGRPPDEIRAKLRELGATKALPFLDNVLGGQIAVTLIGKCAVCKHEQPYDAATLETVLQQVRDAVKATTDQQLKASEQAMKYGLQAKELVITSGNAASFFDCVTAAAVELFGSEGAESLKARTLSMMEGTK